MIKRVIISIVLIGSLAGCAFMKESYPGSEGHYIINSINNETAYISDLGDTEIEIDGVVINIYSMLLDNEYGAITYKVNGKMHGIECLSDEKYNDCYLAPTSITADNGEIIGLLQVPRTRDGGFDSFQRYLDHDLLFSLDPITGESNIFYETKGKYQRIVGYDEGLVYLYQNNRIYEVDLSNNKTTFLQEIKPYEELEFNWTEEGLAIDNNEDDYHELIKITD